MDSQSELRKYAILSHTWGDDEVTFQDMQGELPVYKKGFSKVERSCKQAKSDGLDYIWIDTCCIDKSSSAELSETINSMYQWYKKAMVCYAYLSDVPPSEAQDPRDDSSSFRKSRWFTRGWTLQELIAPRLVIFFSESWTSLGTKWQLLTLLSDITSIDSAWLRGGEDALSIASIAQKMSWAANRTTTRLEDRAYSLLGIFDVNMPLLYGEGQKAFTRLQEEILKQTDDESLFAHQIPPWSSLTGFFGSLLAQSPDCFSQSRGVFSYTREPRLHLSLEPSLNVPPRVTKKGLRVYSFGCPCAYGNEVRMSGWLMILDCRLKSDILARPAVFLVWLREELDHFIRFNTAALLIVRRIRGKATIENWENAPTPARQSTSKAFNTELRMFL